MTAPKVAVVVSDLHCGSTVALMPDRMEIADGVVVRPSPLQEIINGCWKEIMGPRLEAVVGSDPWVLVVNGDCTEGVHHRTKQVWSLEHADHCAAAIEMLGPLAAWAIDSGGMVFVVRGTESHVGQSAESNIGYAIGAQKADDGSYAAHNLRLRMHGCLCQFSHHVSATTRAYLEASQLSIRWGNDTLEAARAGEEPARVYGFAHRHRYGWWENSSAAAFSTPSWQALTNYGHKVVGGAVPEFGAVVLDWRGLEYGSIPRHHRLVVQPVRRTIREVS